jgi:threonylcarbamoyladenosine tRNA methylthiotransferase MtaB
MGTSFTTFFVTSTGCRTNQHETESIMRRLCARGYRGVESADAADVVIVNTCSVTGHTEAKVRRLLASIARTAPGARICVTGCLAQQAPAQIERMSNVRWVVGNARKDDLVAILESRECGVFSAPLSPPPPLVVQECFDCGPPVLSRTRFTVKIQEGCDRACAYCIVPSLRGPSRSAAAGDVLAACEKALGAGVKEIVLTGTHIGQYRDRGGIEDLVEKIALLDGDEFRIRLSSCNPGDMSERLLQLAENGPRVCRHIHVSLQSLCPDVLRAMNRSPGETLACAVRLAELRARRPDFGIGADFITGFPSETPEMADLSCLRVTDIGFSYAHIFRYSPRPATPAAVMRPQVAEKEKRRRSDMLRAAVAGSRKYFIERLAGTVHRILVEKSRPVTGISSNYLRFRIDGADRPCNSWLDVRLSGFDPKRGMCTGTVDG